MMGGNEVTLVAVINSFNRRALLEKAVAALGAALEQAPFSGAMVVFEVGSTDGSIEFLEKWQREHPAAKLEVVRPLDGRSSFSAGVNRGCAFALERFPACRWLLLYETDNWLAGAEPLQRAIQLLETQPKLGAAGFTVGLHEGKKCGYGMRFPSPLSLIAGQHLCLKLGFSAPNDTPWQESPAGKWRTCDVVFTSPLLIRREAWEQTGGFDAEQFPFSESDLDWAWRMQEVGWHSAVLQSDAVVHDNLEQASGWSANRLVDLHRSRLALLQRHRGWMVNWIKPFLFLRHTLEWLALKSKGAAGADRAAVRWKMMGSVWRDYRA